MRNIPVYYTPMDITPELNNITPNYAGKKRKSRIEDIVTQVLVGDISEHEFHSPKPLTKKECAVARQLLMDSMNARCMQLLGGAPRILDSDEEKAAERQYRQYERAFKKLLRWLDYWEGK